MIKHNISWWLFTLVGITTSCFALKAQFELPAVLVAEEAHPFFGSLSLDTTRMSPPMESFNVFTQYPGKGTLPMLGKWVNKVQRYYFVPRFPFRQGETYWMKWKGENGKVNISSFDVPIRKEEQAPSIVGIYPSADHWPANQLKIYVQFDQPMREGLALRYIQILNEQGEVVERPFLDMGQELWDKDHRRLTLWFDPGRIKTGLIPNEKYGPPLLPNRVYQLSVLPGYLARNGIGMEEQYRKTFHTRSKDQDRPDPRQWELHLPLANTRQALQLQFSASLDFGLLKTGIWIENALGQPIEGEVEIGAEERSWSWVPTSPWKKGHYHLRIDEDLEDLAGNNLQRLFDTPIKDSADHTEPLPTSIQFEIKVKH